MALLYFTFIIPFFIYWIILIILILKKDYKFRIDNSEDFIIALIYSILPAINYFVIYKMVHHIQTRKK